MGRARDPHVARGTWDPGVALPPVFSRVDEGVVGSRCSKARVEGEVRPLAQNLGGEGESQPWIPSPPFWIPYMVGSPFDSRC